VDFGKGDCSTLICVCVALGRTDVGDENGFHFTKTLEVYGTITIREKINVVLEFVEKSENFFGGVNSASSTRAFETGGCVDGITEDIVQELVETDDTRGARTGVHTSTKFEIARERVFRIFSGGDVIKREHDSLNEFEGVEKEAEHIHTATSNILEVRLGLTTCLEERCLQGHETVTNALDLDDAEASGSGIHESEEFVKHGNHGTTRGDTRDTSEANDISEGNPADGEMFVVENREATFAAIGDVGSLSTTLVLTTDGTGLSGGLFTELADVSGSDGVGDVSREDGVQEGSGFLIFAELEDVEKKNDAKNTNGGTKNGEESNREGVDGGKIIIDTFGGDGGELIERTHDVALPVVIEETVSKFHSPSLVGFSTDGEVGSFFVSESGITGFTKTISAFHGVGGTIFDINEGIRLTLGFIKELKLEGGEAGFSEATGDGTWGATSTGLHTIGDVQIPEDSPGLNRETGDTVADVDDFEEVLPEGVVTSDGVGADETSQVIRRDTHFLSELTSCCSILGGLLGFISIVEKKTKDNDETDNNDDVKSHSNISSGDHIFLFLLF